jgi:methylated-DNA-protein-cysteine methyltransferase related protein
MNFFESVYEIVKKIPYGKVTTYGQIAILIGNPRSSRAVGWALNKNPNNKIIPCHRVVNKNGEISKAFAFGGENAQKELLVKEGVKFTSSNAVDLSECLWNID